MDFDLERFVKAQDRFYSTALRELLGGHKKSHWMWFIFPQIRGLGRSETARLYAISGRSEAVAYLNNSIWDRVYRNAHMPCSVILIAAYMIF